MKWHNLNIGVKISINSGTALILFLISFFGLVVLAAFFPAVERLFVPALTGLTGALGGYLVKRANNNKLASEETKAKIGVVNGAAPTEK